MTNFPIAEFENQRTPFYFYDIELLRKTLDEIKRYSNYPGYHVHYAIKANANPLLLKVQIMRIRESDGALTLYAGRFVDMIHDEETLVRRAVFDIQLKTSR